MKITTAGLLLEYLRTEGVKYIFVIPGTSLVPLFAVLNRQDAIRPILCKDGKSGKATPLRGIGIEDGYEHSLLGCAWLDRDASYK